MNWGLAGQITVVVIPSLVLLHVIVKRSREWYAPRLTVEAEQVESRQVIACIGQHHPAEGDCADDSISSFVAGMELDRRVNAITK